MRKKFAITMSLFLLSISIIGCSSKAYKKVEQSKILLSVETQDVKTGSIESNITVSGKVEPNKEISVIPKMAGMVSADYFELGDTVSKGDVLFKIDDSDIKTQVSQAEASLNVAKANYNLTVNATTVNQIQQVQSSVDNLQLQYDDLLTKLNDTKELYNEGVVAKQDLDTLQTNVDAIKLQLDSAKKNLDLMKNNIADGTKTVSKATIKQAESGVNTAKHQLSNTVVTASMGGVVTVDNVMQGQMISMQQPSMVISDIDTVKINLSVSEDAISHISVGSKIYVTIEALSEKPFVSSVSKVSQVADKKTSLYPIEVKLENYEHKIKPGMFASVKIVMSNKGNIITLPINAVMQKDDETYVFTIDDKNIVHKTTVRLGVQNENSVEITSGLSQGMKVVVKGQDFITDKTEVSVSNEEVRK